jgi:hypothetical protein
MNPTSRTRALPRGAALLAAVLCAAALARPARAQGDAAPRPSVDVTRAALEKWAEARRLISKARSDWRVDQGALEERIAMQRRAITQLKERVAAVEKSIGDAEREQQQLQAENSAFAAVSTTMAERVTGLEQQTRALLQRLPEPVRDRVKPISQQFPEAAPDRPDAQKRLSVAARFGNVLGVLGIVHKQNREIALTSEVRTLQNGTTAEVSCLYFGLGQAYYVTAKGDAAGIGTATPTGWVWQPADAAAPAIQRAIAVYQGKTPPAFVPLPVQIQ